jgi:hypothetical protein
MKRRRIHQKSKRLQCPFVMPCRAMQMPTKTPAYFHNILPVCKWASECQKLVQVRCHFFSRDDIAVIRSISGSKTPSKAVSSITKKLRSHQTPHLRSPSQYLDPSKSPPVYPFCDRTQPIPWGCSNQWSSISKSSYHVGILIPGARHLPNAVLSWKLPLFQGREVPIVRRLSLPHLRGPPQGGNRFREV